MKIKQIKLISPELYLVTYITRWLKRKVERYVITETTKIHLPLSGRPMTGHTVRFRDNDELAHDCWHQIEWMIRNDVDFFDNTQSPDPDWPRPDKLIVRPVTKDMVDDSLDLYPRCELCGNHHHPIVYCKQKKEHK